MKIESNFTYWQNTHIPCSNNNLVVMEIYIRDMMQRIGAVLIEYLLNAGDNSDPDPVYEDDSGFCGHFQDCRTKDLLAILDRDKLKRVGRNLEKPPG